MITSLGPYSLGANFQDLQDLCEVSSLEYQVLPKMFPGEKILSAPPVDFLDHEWRVTIGAIGDHIYKIAALVFSIEAGEAHKTFSQAYGFCEVEMGKPTERKGPDAITKEGFDLTLPFGSLQNTITWNTSSGSVILSQGLSLVPRMECGQNFIYLILTSANRPDLKGWTPRKWRKWKRKLFLIAERVIRL